MAMDELVINSSPTHPANLICELCKLFYGTARKLHIETDPEETDGLQAQAVE
jgi:hypothetical protein